MVKESQSTPIFSAWMPSVSFHSRAVLTYILWTRSADEASSLFSSLLGFFFTAAFSHLSLRVGFHDSEFRRISLQYRLFASTA